MPQKFNRPPSPEIKVNTFAAPVEFGKMGKDNSLNSPNWNGNLTGKMDLLQGSLAAIPMMRSGDSLMGGGAKIALGLGAQTQIGKAFPSLVGGKSLGALGALGGGLAISGIADVATSLLPNFAAIPASAFGGYIVGSQAFTGLGLTSGFAGILGAGLGIGFGIYSLINNRRAKERAQKQEAEWYAERTEEVMGVIGRYAKNLPLIDDEVKRLDKQYNINMNIIGLNEMENARFNFKTTESIDEQARKMNATLNVKLAQAGMSSAGLGWFLQGEVEDKQIKALDEENWRYNVDAWKMALRKEQLYGDYKASQAGLLYARYTVENELEYAQRQLSKNLGKLGSNPMATGEQRARAASGAAWASGLRNQIGEGTSKLERSYYG